MQKSRDLEFNEERSSSPDLFTDLKDGSYFKNHPLYSTKKYAFQIQLYYDDFEPVNALGSKRGIHKIGCLYLVVRNLLHLVSLFHVQDQQKYGFDAILRPFINDVKKLDSHGLDLPCFDEPVYGTMAQWHKSLVTVWGCTQFLVLQSHLAVVIFVLV